MNCSDALTRLENETSALINSGAVNNFDKLFDDGNYTVLDKFQRSTKGECEVHTAFGYISGCPSYAYYQDINLSYGAMGRMQAKKIKRIYDLAADNGMPVIAVFDSNGAHIDESIDALNAYGELISAASSLSGVVPQISVIAGTCIGSAAILASISDFSIVLKDSEFYVNSPNILGDKGGFIGSGENAYNNGNASFFVNNVAEAFDTVKNIMAYLPQNNLEQTPIFDSISNELVDSGSALNIIKSSVDSGSLLITFSGYANDIITGFARVHGRSVGIISTDSDNAVISSDGAIKAAKMVRFCDAFSIPIISFVNCKGFLGKLEDEKYGYVKSVATLAHAYAEATTPKISIITGYAIGTGFVAFCSGDSNDFVYALPCAKIGTLTASCAVELFKKDELKAGANRKELEATYEDDECSPFIAAGFGYVNDVFALEEAREKLNFALSMLSGKRVNTLNKKHSNLPF